MKRLLSLLCALMLAVLPLCSAMAETLDEWNRSCRKKTKGTTTVYSRSDNTRVIDTIPGNTYVKVADVGEVWTIIAYKTAEGRSGTGLVHTSDLKSAVIYFTDENGDSRGLQELEYYDLYGSNPPGSGSTSTDTPGSASSGNGKSSGSTSAKRSSTAKKQSTETAPVITHEGETVTVTQLGVYTTTIIKAGETVDVPTAALSFAEDVPADKGIAVIHAPRTGKCTLREKASDSAKSLGKCKAGAIVAVLAYGRRYCRIVYDGEVGYVLTSCLKFYGEADAPTGTGVLTYNGKATGRTAINVRNAADGDSHKIAEWRTGTEVAVFGLEDGWYEIEHDGMHGFVQKKFLTLDE